MQINMKDLTNSIISNFNFHDAYIKEVKQTANEITLLLEDGYIKGQLNELTFINYDINNKFPLENRTIYQLEDLVHFEKSNWIMSLLVWTADDLLEKVTITSNNINLKLYKIKDNLIKEDNFSKQMEELTKEIGELTEEKLKNKNTEEIIHRIFKTKEKEEILNNFNNYNLINEENLNKYTHI